LQPQDSGVKGHEWNSWGRTGGSVEPTGRYRGFLGWAIEFG